MRPDVDSHEVGQRGPERSSVQTDLHILDTFSSECRLLKCGHWYLNRELLQLACHIVSQATYLGKGQYGKSEFSTNWGYSEITQMCDQIATEYG